MKREGGSTLLIRSYLRAISCLLDHFENALFKNVFCGLSLKVF